MGTNEDKPPYDKPDPLVNVELVIQHSLLELERRFTEALEASARTTIGILKSQDEHIKALEDQNAVLVLGYADITVAIETFVAHMKFDTAEERAEFDNQMDQNRRKMLKVMQDAAATMDGPDKRTAETLSNLVQEQSDKDER